MRNLVGIWKLIASLVVAIWAIFMIYTALTQPMHSLFQGALSLGCAFILLFLLYPIDQKKVSEEATSLKQKLIFGTTSSPSWLDIFFIILALVPLLYIMYDWEQIAWAVGRYETYQVTLGVFLVIMLLEGTRRALGKEIPLVVLFFIFYALLGDRIPGFFGHGGYGVQETLYQLYMMTDGIWGLLTDLTSRLIALFVILGPVLFAVGVGKGFMDLAKFVGGRTTGGAGQLAVITSASFGTLSGSAVANVATTGAFTIPTMKRLGYKSNLAGAIEAAASGGGQLMPPIMGAGAFIMAEFLMIPYLHVVAAGIIPAIIYFAGVWSGIWVEAKRLGLGRLPAELIPPKSEVFHPYQILVLVLPIGLLIYLLVQHYPPQLCAAWALVVAMGMYLATGGSLRVREIWERIKVIGQAYYRGIATALCWLMVMMSCIQMAVTLISMTGFGVKISSVIISLAGVNLLLALILTMLCAIILGMGMTTTAAYVIAAAVLGPAIAALGVPDLAGHLFIFYFAVISGITPPVCIAVFTASAIARGSWLNMAGIAMRLGIGAYIVPFFFVFEPKFLLDGEPLAIIVTLVLAVLAIFCIISGMMGHWFKPTSIIERFIFLGAGFCLLYPSFDIQLLGLGLVALGALSQYLMPEIPIIGTRRASATAADAPGDFSEDNNSSQ